MFVAIVVVPCTSRIIECNTDSPVCCSFISNCAERSYRSRANSPDLIVNAFASILCCKSFANGKSAQINIYIQTVASLMSNIDSCRASLCAIIPANKSITRISCRCRSGTGFVFENRARKANRSSSAT